PSITGETVYCVGETIQLSTPGQVDAFFQWTLPDGTLFEETSGEYILANAGLAASGTYSLYAHRHNCYSDTTTFTLQVNAHPVFTLMSDTTLCTDQQIEIAGPSGFETYAWNTGDTTQNITVEEGICELTVTDENGCT